MHSISSNKTYTGFSLIEVILTLGILMTISIFVFPLTTEKVRLSRLNDYASQLTTDIYFQQQESYFKKASKGVVFNTDGYTVFEGENYSEATDEFSKSFPRNISITTTISPTPNQILFNGESFKPISYGEVIISDGQNSIELYINKEGLVDYEIL